MIRKLLSITALAALSTAAFAGSCPLLMNDIDAALADPNVEQRLGDDELEEAQRLRKEGEEAHRAGDHTASVEALNRAKEILGISQIEGGRILRHALTLDPRMTEAVEADFAARREAGYLGNSDMR